MTTDEELIELLDSVSLEDLKDKNEGQRERAIRWAIERKRIIQ